jgi:hypothetical protein
MYVYANFIVSAATRQGRAYEMVALLTQSPALLTPMTADEVPERLAIYDQS